MRRDFCSNLLQDPLRQQHQMVMSGLVYAFVLVHASAWLASSPGVTRRGFKSPARGRGLASAPTPAVPDEETDVVVIGSGIGGLSCAAMLAKYGYDVLVCEAHDAPGGAAHEFTRRVPGVDGVFRFDSGPSLFSGCSASSANPLRQVLDAVGEAPEWLTYSDWRMYFPDDDGGAGGAAPVFAVSSGDAAAFGRELRARAAATRPRPATSRGCARPRARSAR